MLQRQFEKVKTLTAEEMTAAIMAEIEKTAASSAWERGVRQYGSELLEEIAERSAYEGRNPESPEELNGYMLNGADSWAQYSWGGSSLIYDSDIAERLCTPSELKKTRCGERRPNAREEWLDCQARALYQAARKIRQAFRACFGEVVK